LNSFADIALPIGVQKVFTYQIPPELRDQLKIGHRVKIPFQKRHAVGFVVHLRDHTDVKKIKSIESIYQPDIFVSSNDLKLTRWSSEYYCGSWGQFLEIGYPKITLKEENQKSQAKKERTEGLFETSKNTELTDEQTSIVRKIRPAIENKKFQVFLLHGITGSGKTEVYFDLIENVLKKNTQVLVLFPEIALSLYIAQRFKARFGEERIACWHSGLTQAQRRGTWKNVVDNRVSIVLGARSAVFAPFHKLGLIIVDEEHDSSYKQDEAPRYHGRDVAVMRAKIQDCPIVLGSATPSCESYSNAQKNNYLYLNLNKRYKGSELPVVKVVDMTVEEGFAKRKIIFSNYLIQAIHERLKKREQVMLFLNKRGFSRWVSCLACGFVIKCIQCDITMVYHKEANSLKCHYCGQEKDFVRACPECKDGLLKGFGKGTERIEEITQKIFSKARIQRLDTDKARNKKVLADILQKFQERDIDILVGTQMITKGFDFPHVTLIGILQADHMLSIPDYRASERVYQLLTQVTGRAGRRDQLGEVVIQTFNVDHYAVKSTCRHDYLGFINTELKHRKSLFYPPYSRMICIEVKGRSRTESAQCAQELCSFIKKHLKDPPVKVTGPLTAIVPRVRNFWRFQILIKGTIGHQDKKRLGACLSAFRAPKAIMISVDVDPVNLI